MNFIESLKYIYQNRKDNNEIINPFYVYCQLSDLCNTSYEDVEKVKQYWKITSKINIADVLLQNGIDEGLKILKNLYFEISGIKFNEYKECVYYSVKALDANYKFKTKEKEDKKNKFLEKLVRYKKKIFK